MSDGGQSSRVRASLEALSGFFHWSLFIVAAIAEALVYWEHEGTSSRDLATPVFAISGTLVALILPAAALSGAYVEPRITHWAKALAKPGADLVDVTGRGRGSLAGMEEVVTPLWRGFLFALVSLPLSAAALFQPDFHLAGISAEEVLVAVSLALVMVAVFSFLPFVWEILQLDLIRDTRKKLFETPSATQPVDSPGPPPPMATAEPPDGQSNSASEAR